MIRIAVVEDEKDLATIVCKYLEKQGYETTLFVTGETAIMQVAEDFQLWILDIMLPGNTSGYDLIKAIRRHYPKMPVIFTSARDQDIDKIMGLELGSDDYLAKPYSIRELVLRVKNLLARAYDTLNEKGSMVSYNGYTVDIDKRIVYEEDVAITLTSKEYDLLVFLLENKGKAFSREQILYHIWGNEYYGSDRVVDDLLRRLRQKLPNLIVETIYGYGYRLK